MSLLPIVFADDDKEDHLLVQLALHEIAAFNPLVTVENGVELFDYLNNQPPFEDVDKFPKPGLILLDLIMPVKGGLDALAELKATPSFADIPVVLFSGTIEEKQIIIGRQSNADRFVVKPYKFEELVEIMRDLHRTWLQ
ncbi:response regulator [Aliikangiella sp. IMCC44653]